LATSLCFALAVGEDALVLRDRVIFTSKRSGPPGTRGLRDAPSRRIPQVMEATALPLPPEIWAVTPAAGAARQAPCDAKGADGRIIFRVWRASELDYVCEG
jgi:hypothetical protein